jgi:hypothetical protein
MSSPVSQQPGGSTLGLVFLLSKGQSCVSDGGKHDRLIEFSVARPLFVH